MSSEDCPGTLQYERNKCTRMADEKADKCESNASESAAIGRKRRRLCECSLVRGMTRFTNAFSRKLATRRHYQRQALHCAAPVPGLCSVVAQGEGGTGFSPFPLS